MFGFFPPCPGPVLQLPHSHCPTFNPCCPRFVVGHRVFNRSVALRHEVRNTSVEARKVQDPRCQAVLLDDFAEPMEIAAQHGSLQTEKEDEARRRHEPSQMVVVPPAIRIFRTAPLHDGHVGSNGCAMPSRRSVDGRGVRSGPDRRRERSWIRSAARRGQPCGGSRGMARARNRERDL